MSMAEGIATQHGAELRDAASYLRPRIYLFCTEYSFMVLRGAAGPRNVRPASPRECLAAYKPCPIVLFVVVVLLQGPSPILLLCSW